MALRTLTSFSRPILRTLPLRPNANGFRLCSSSSKKPLGFKQITLWSASGGALLGAGYSVYTHYDINKQKITKPQQVLENLVLEKPPDVKPTRRVIGTVGNNLEITLFQYQTCPFCSKVRAFLDYHGFSYDIVEVDAVLRQSIKWSKYKKVPTVLVKSKGGYQQLNDSTVIISILQSYLISENLDVEDVINFYPSVTISQDEKAKEEVLNKYFLMYERMPVNKKIELVNEERKWRRWADDVMVHMISPNVYRTLDEAFQTFEWFATIGEWRENFPAWEVKLMINVGAYVMYMIGKRLKKKHGLKDDVRLSIYDECNYWMKQINNQNTQFKGGAVPDLSDLAVYGVLSSMEGCDAFQDVLRNSNIGRWYYDVKEIVTKNQGVVHKE